MNERFGDRLGHLCALKDRRFNSQSLIHGFLDLIVEMEWNQTRGLYYKALRIRGEAGFH